MFFLSLNVKMAPFSFDCSHDLHIWILTLILKFYFFFLWVRFPQWYFFINNIIAMKIDSMQCFFDSFSKLMMKIAIINK